MSDHKNSKRYISRISIKKRTKTNPEQHREPLCGYFNKVKRDHSLLNPHAQVRNQSQLLYYRTENNTKLSNDFSHLNKFNSTANTFKMKANMESSNQKLQSDKRSDQKLEKSIKQSPKHINSFLTKAEPKIQQNKEYMSYNQYENLLKKGNILPNYFQKVANRNDNKLQTHLTKSFEAEIPKINNKNKQKQNIVRIKSQFMQDIQSLLKKHKKKHLTSNSFHQTDKITTIITSNLGALSDQTIREKLEEKWDQQLKFQTINKFIPTEQSEIASEKDTRQISIKDETNPWALKKKVKKENEIEALRVSEIESIANQKHKTRLKRIFTKKEGSGITDQNLSKGQEYHLLQQNMVRLNNLYRPKKFALKHKIEWKV